MVKHARRTMPMKTLDDDPSYIAFDQSWLDRPVSILQSHWAQAIAMLEQWFHLYDSGTDDNTH
jgi:hypothetical protein